MTAPAAEHLLPLGVGYRMVLPEGWLRLPANPIALRPAARRMLAERFAALPRDSTAQVRRELEDELVRLADTASGQFAVDLLLLGLDVDRRPVSGSCVVSVVPVPLPDPEHLDRLAEHSRDGALRSEVLRLGSNTVVRVVRDQLSADVPGMSAAPLPAQAGEQVVAAVREMVGPDAVTQASAAPVSRLVDVFVPVPDSAATLLLSFSTPVRPLFEPLTELFTALAGTVQFTAEGSAWR